MSLTQAEEFIQRIIGDPDFRSRFFGAPSDESRRALLAQHELDCDFAEVQKVLAKQGQHFTEQESEIIASAMLGKLSDESLAFITGGVGSVIPFVGATGVPPYGGGGQSGGFPFLPGATGI